MDSVAVLNHRERNDLFVETARKRRMTNSAIIEKDFWVCWALDKISSLDPEHSHIIFKGGTSLSKVFGVIKRFSEDIDLSISRECLGFSEASYLSQGMSNKEIDRRLDELKKRCSEYISQKLLPSLADRFKKILGETGEWSLQIDDQDPHTILFNYPYDQSLSGDYSYIKSTVRFELGARSDHWPSKIYEISSYAAEEFPAYFQRATCAVKTLEVERTFWEKATLLHAEFHHPKSLSNYSRHYYDLALMIKGGVGDRSLSDLSLLGAVREHKSLFYRSKASSYETACPGTFRLLPSGKQISLLKDDYKSMKEMIFADIPTFEEIMNILRSFENKINQGNSS